MADRKMGNTAFVLLERAMQHHPLPWPKLRYQSIDSRTCIASFPDLNEEETDVLIAELLMGPPGDGTF